MSLAERLKQRREELGISQSQAARELDVARTAYRLWEMEAARPAPDRWRLIASWLGVSMTTMLLAEDLVSEDEAKLADIAELSYARTGRDWRRPEAATEGDFFAQAQALIGDGTASGALTPEQAAQLKLTVERIEQEKIKADDSVAWEEAELRRSLPANDSAPRAARQALRVVAEGVSDELLATGELLLSELVTRSVKHRPSRPSTKVGIFIAVGGDVLRAEVFDGSTRRRREASGGYGRLLLDSLASAWGSRRSAASTVTWFELELPLPGSSG